MTGIFSKLRVVTLGGIHDLLDKAIDLNSPSALRQYVRDLETAIGQLNAEAAGQTGQLRTMNRERGDLDSKIQTLKVEITHLLTADPASTVARSKGALVLQYQTQLTGYDTSITNQTKVVTDLNTAVQNLNAKHDLMVARVRELERIDRDTRAKSTASAAITQAGSILGGVGTQSIDDLQDRMLRKNDAANATFDQSMASMTPEPETNSADVDALLASLKG